jgi:hypothetical protein
MAASLPFLSVFLLYLRQVEALPTLHVMRVGGGSQFYGSKILNYFTFAISIHRHTQI